MRSSDSSPSPDIKKARAKGHSNTLEALATKCKQLEEALRESEQKYYHLADSLPQIVFEIDKQGKIVFLNRYGLQLTGLSAEEIENGLNVFQFIVSQDRDRTKENISRILNSEKIAWQEYVAVRKDGSTFPVAAFSTPIYLNQKAIGLIGIAIDMTERKRVEEVLKQSEEKYRALFEQKLDGVIVIDQQMRLVMANVAVAEIFGADSVEELLTLNIFDYIAPEERQRTLEIITKDMFEKNLRQTNEFRCMKKSGEEIWVSAVGSRIEDQGQVMGLVSFRDITAQKQSELELEKSQRELRNLSEHLQSVREEERTSIAQEIHDDCGQSLTALKMDISWLRRRLRKDQQTLIDKLDIMSGLADSTILSVKRIMSQLRPRVLDDFGLVAAIEWMAQEFQGRTAIRCGLNLTSDNLRLDKQMETSLFRVLQEALTNVSRHAAADEVAISLTQQDGELTLEIADNGRGITSEQISSPESFGLIGIRERIRRFGGKVAIRGVAGKGTTIGITIRT